MDRSETLFLLHIMDGYSFRNAIGMIKNETVYATMILSPKTVEISFVSSNRCAMHKIKINTAELSRYVYNVRDEEGRLLPEYPIAFETNTMLNTTKGIGKRDGIRLYCLKDDDKINVQPIKTSSKDPGRAGVLFVSIENREYEKVIIDDVYDSEPNVRVHAKDFADICIQANASKANALQIIGGKKSIIFKALLPNNTVASINKFVSQIDVCYDEQPLANMDEIDNILGYLETKEHNLKSSAPVKLNVISSDELTDIRVPSSALKSLSKIHNISHQGTQIKFFHSANHPIKLSTPLSTYGEYTICLRNTGVSV